MAQPIGFGQTGQNPPAQNPSVVATPPATATQQPSPPTPTVTTYAPLNPPAPTRVPYTRHATPGKDDDQIRATALVNFWKTMTVLGSLAILWILISTSYCVGHHRGVTPVVVTPPPAVETAPPPAKEMAIPPAPAQPQVIVVPVPQPVQQVVFPPSAPATNQTPQVETRPLSDAEQRNEALKERLRLQYDIR